MGECDLTCIPTGPLCCCAESRWEGRQARGESEEEAQAAMHVREAGAGPVEQAQWASPHAR